MKTEAQFVFYLSLFVTLLMGSLSYLTYRRSKEREYIHLTEFWGALALNSIVMNLFAHMMPSVVALSMVGWIWPLRGFKLFLEDHSGQKLRDRWAYSTLLVGAFVTVALASYGFDFAFYTFPFALAVAVVGFSRIYSSVRHTKDINFFHWASYLLMGLFFLSCLAFPFWRVKPATESYGGVVALILNIGFAGVGLCAYLDLTLRRHEKMTETLIRERNERLLGQSKYSELGMMSAGIAHEINNPLAVIQARTTQLLRVYRDPTKHQDLADGLQQILYTSERINRTIQGVREFVHQDERGPETEIELRQLVDDVLAFCGQRMKNHGINLRFYGLDDYTVVGNKIQLEQVLLNLLNNSFDAIEYLPDKWIEISAHQTGDKIQIYVKDSGTGIPPEISARIMEPFYSTKDLGKGTGLGLALARGIAEKHHGSLQYLNNTSHTTFMLELPREAHSDWGIPLH